VLQPESLRAAGVTGGADGVADLFVLPDDDARVDVAENELELAGALPPVDGAEDAADLGSRDESLHHTVTVLAEPQDAVARREAFGKEGVGETVDPFVHLDVAVPIRAAHERVAAWVAPPVLAQHIAEGQ
jgi:hypothetical protein